MSPINVINNSLNIMIFKGGYQGPTTGSVPPKNDGTPDVEKMQQNPNATKRSKTRSRPRAYYSD